MTDASPSVAIYQLHASLLEISPAIWRRLHIRSDTTIANLHYMLQIAFGWTDSHLHRFVIYGKVYGITQPGGICFADEPRQVRLSDLRLHMNGRFGYEYDFGDLWHHQLRLERILPFDNTRTYPYCSGGARAAPPEDCGGPWAFLTLKQQYTPWWIADQLLAILHDEPHDLELEDLSTLLYWLQVDQFDRRAVKGRLHAYARGDAHWWCA
jgi:hypothetical protein